MNTACITRSFATSDNAIHGRKTLPDSPGGKSQLLENLTNKTPHKIKKHPNKLLILSI